MEDETHMIGGKKREKQKTKEKEEKKNEIYLHKFVLWKNIELSNYDRFWVFWEIEVATKNNLSSLVDHSGHH